MSKKLSKQSLKDFKKEVEKNKLSAIDINEIEVNRKKFERYHASHKKIYKYISTKNESIVIFRGVGIELEVSSDIKNANNFLIESLKYFKNNTDQTFFAEQDGSIKLGYEIITQPHTFAAFEKFLDKKLPIILNKIKSFGAKDFYNLPQAIHFHISKNFFRLHNKRLEEIKYLTNIYMLFQANIEKINKISKYLEPTNRIYNFENWDECNRYISGVLNLKNMLRTNPYYRKQYFNIYPKHTVEFRIFHSTLDIDEIKCMYRFIKYICKKALKIKKEDCTNWDLWFNDLDEDLKVWLQNKLNKY